MRESLRWDREGRDAARDTTRRSELRVIGEQDSGVFGSGDLHGGEVFRSTVADVKGGNAF